MSDEGTHIRRCSDKFSNVDICDMSRDDRDEFLEGIAQRGAINALKSVGLHDENAAADIRDLRDLMNGWRVIRTSAKQSAFKAAGRIIGWVLVIAFVSITVGHSPTAKAFMIKLMTE